MKRCLILPFLLLFLALPATAETPSTPLQTPSFEGVSGVDITYAVQTEHVASIEVTFRAGLKLKLSNYKDGLLKVSVGTADVLDLSKAIGTATATLTDGTQVAPRLELQKLILDGKKAAFLPGEITAERTGNQIALTLSVPSEKDGLLLAAAYQGDGRMLTISAASMEKEKTEYQILLNNAASAEKVKVFFLTSDFTPMIHAIGLSIPDVS